MLDVHVNECLIRDYTCCSSNMVDVATKPGENSLMPTIPVGQPIPPNVSHAVSVSLPRWQDIVDYEEGRLTDSMQTGYPRFFIHHSIQKVRYDGGFICSGFNAH